MVGLILGVPWLGSFCNPCRFMQFVTLIFSVLHMYWGGVLFCHRLLMTHPGSDHGTLITVKKIKLPFPLHTYLMYAKCVLVSFSYISFLQF